MSRLIVTFVYFQYGTATLPNSPRWLNMPCIFRKRVIKQLSITLPGSNIT